ncbi:unnamed protein product, partial [Oppiella nova]
MSQNTRRVGLRSDTKRGQSSEISPEGCKVLSHKRRGMAARSSHTMNAQKVYPKDSLDRLGDDL